MHCLLSQVSESLNKTEVADKTEKKKTNEKYFGESRPRHGQASRLITVAGTYVADPENQNRYQLRNQ